MHKFNFAIIIPLANESSSFDLFIDTLIQTLDKLNSGTVYLIVDKASTDNTYELCVTLSKKDNRFRAIWSPDNQNVVEAYLRGYKEALKNDHSFILEMDAGLSHDPKAIPAFLRLLKEGNECVFGSRFINGGSISDSNFKRTFLSKTGTLLSNLLLGTNYYDATSGFQGFHVEIVRKFVGYNLKSKAHFYQTELRYLLRQTKYIEAPIHYQAPSPRVSKKAIINSIQVLLYYFFLRLTFKSARII
jgi:dolichol-phosphate mannosyltransferase